MDVMLDLSSLRLEDHPRLDNMPLDILLIIFSYLNTARAIASIGAACKRLRGVVQASGWRIFVRAHFESMSLPKDIKDQEEWSSWARKLTSHSRSWERRQFSVESFGAPVKKPPRDAHGTGPRLRFQTVPPHIMVAATSTFEEGFEKETVAWGAGEDIVVRWRKLSHSVTKSEAWMATEGPSLGFKSGKDDVTAISILASSGSDTNILVGRASGHLQVLSTNRIKPAQVVASLQPAMADGTTTCEQKDIQAFDVNISGDTAAVITKDSTLIYSLDHVSTSTDNVVTAVQPIEALGLRGMQDSQQFRSLRTIKFMSNGDMALGLTSSPEPLRYLTRTPTGLVMLNAMKLRPSNRCTQSYIHDTQDLQTVRDLLPVNAMSAASGSGNVILGSYDDSTVRLQDLRTPCHYDTIYQDHFEVLTPVGPLTSYGMERFIAGSARTASLKIFDFRWTKPYHYTDALPCDRVSLAPTPRPPTMVAAPSFLDHRKCNHLLGRLCRCHALAKTDFYRPNCNVYLPVSYQLVSPIYSLAKSSELSATVYAGMTGELIALSTRDQGERLGKGMNTQRRMGQDRAGYVYRESLISIIETGDGIALNDISKSQRVPEIRKQKVNHSRPPYGRSMFRLDSCLV